MTRLKTPSACLQYTLREDSAKMKKNMQLTLWWTNAFNRQNIKEYFASLMIFYREKRAGLSVNCLNAGDGDSNVHFAGSLNSLTPWSAPLHGLQFCIGCIHVLLQSLCPLVWLFSVARLKVPNCRTIVCGPISSPRKRVIPPRIVVILNAIQVS